MSDCPEELTAQERAALLGWLFAHGWQPTTRQVATRLGLTWSGASSLLEQAARVIPIARDDSVSEAYWYSIEHVPHKTAEPQG